MKFNHNNFGSTPQWLVRRKFSKKFPIKDLIGSEFLRNLKYVSKYLWTDKWERRVSKIAQDPNCVFWIDRIFLTSILSFEMGSHHLGSKNGKGLSPFLSAAFREGFGTHREAIPVPFSFVHFFGNNQKRHFQNLC